MTLFTAETGTNAALLTVGNTGWNSVGGTTAIFTNARSHSGLLGYRFSIPGGTVETSSGNMLFPAATKEPAADFWAYLTSNPTTNPIRFATFRNAAGTAMFVRLMANGTFQIQNTTGGGSITSTATVPLNQWVRFSLRAHIGTTTSNSFGDVTVFDAAGKPVDSVAIVNANLGTTDIVSMTVGKSDPDTHSGAWVADLDDINLASGANGYLRPENPEFGTLQTVSPQEEWDGGVRHAMEEFNRRSWETVQGTLLASYTTAVNNRITTRKNLGFKITLGLGLHYAPTWYGTLPGTIRKVNQRGETDTSGQNMIFSASARASAENYLALVNGAITGGFAGVDRIRLTSADRGEVLYPENTGGVNQYNWWGFDAAAQNGTDLAAGMVANPWPGWLPGQALPAGATNVGPWLDWYIDALVRTVIWQMNYLRGLGFKGIFEITMPGSGVRPSVWTAMHADTTLLTNNTAAVGAVWQTIAANLPYRSITSLHCTSVANSTSTAFPSTADLAVGITSTTANGWTPGRWILRNGAEYGQEVSGENPGFQMGISDAQYKNTGPGGLMDLTFSTINAPGMAYNKFDWAHSGPLHDGTIPASAYYAEIAAVFATTPVLVAGSDQDRTVGAPITVIGTATTTGTGVNPDPPAPTGPIRLYLTNSAPSYTPATVRGTWTDASRTGNVYALSPTKAGTNIEVSAAETSTTNPTKVLLSRHISGPLQGGQVNSETQIIVTMPRQESDAAANLTVQLAAWVTVGNSDVVRGWCVNPFAGATEFATALTAFSFTLGFDTTFEVQPQDRLVVELGFSAANAVATSYTGTTRIGGTSATDLATTGTTGVTTDSPWVELTGTNATAVFAPYVPGSPGALTDQTFLSFTASNSLTSGYHVFAAGISAAGPIPVIIELHGDGAFSYLNPNSTYYLGGTNGLRAKGKAKGYMVVSALAPDTTGSVTWWENGASKALYLKELIDKLDADYDIDRSQLWFSVFSGGSQQLTQYYLPAYSSTITGGGAVIFGGGDTPQVSVVPYAAALKTKFPMHWISGEFDDGVTTPTSGFNGKGAALDGYNYYTAQGFAGTTYELIPDRNHDLPGLFGGLVDNWLPFATRAPETGTPASVITSLTGSFTALPPGTSAPALSGTATGLGTYAASLVQTFTPQVPGKYTWTVTAVSGTFSIVDSADIWVAPAVGQAVPVLTVNNVGGYVNVGGAPSIQAAITDNNDTTVAESPSSPTGSARIQIRTGPYQSGTIRLSVRGDKVGTGAITRFVRLYKSTDPATPVYTTSFALPSSAETVSITPDSAALAALTLQDRRELIWDISDISDGASQPTGSANRTITTAITATGVVRQTGTASRQVTVGRTATGALVTGGAPTAPTTNLLMRFRADDITAANGAAVSSWAEATGLPAATQADATKQPTLATASINGHQAVRFNGIDDFLSLSGAALGVAQNRAALGIFIVYRYVSVISGVRTLLSLASGTGAASNRAIVYHRDSGAFIGMGGRRLDADTAQFISGSAASVLGSSECVGACYDYANNDIFLYKDGSLIGTSAAFQTVGSTSNTASLAGTIGARLDGTLENTNVDIAEILVYSAADATLRAGIADYVQDTYGITMADSTGGTPPASEAMSTWHAALANRENAPATIFVAGDSVSEGTGSGTRGGRWVDRFRDTVRTNFPTAGVTGGQNYLPSHYFHTETWANTHSASTGTITYLNYQMNLGIRTSRLAAGATMTFPVTGGSADIWWHGGGGTWTWRVDSGTTSAVLSSAGSGPNNKTNISLGTAGSHTITITSVSGNFDLEGFTVYNGDSASGVQMFEGAHHGSWAASISDASDYNGWVNCVQGINPDLVIIFLGLNDNANSSPAANYQADINKIVTSLGNFTNRPSVLLIAAYTAAAPYGTNWQAYVTALQTIASTRTDYVEVLNLSALMPAAPGGGFYNGDNVHPNGSGHTEIARLVNLATSP